MDQTYVGDINLPPAAAAAAAAELPAAAAAAALAPARMEVIPGIN